MAVVNCVKTPPTDSRFLYKPRIIKRETQRNPKDQIRESNVNPKEPKGSINALVGNQKEMETKKKKTKNVHTISAFSKQNFQALLPKKKEKTQSSMKVSISLNGFMDLRIDRVQPDALKPYMNETDWEQFCDDFEDVTVPLIQFYKKFWAFVVSKVKFFDGLSKYH